MRACSSERPPGTWPSTRAVLSEPRRIKEEGQAPGGGGHPMHNSKKACMGSVLRIMEGPMTIQSPIEASV